MDKFDEIRIQVDVSDGCSAVYYYYDECCKGSKHYESMNVISMPLDSCWYLFYELN